MAEDPGQPPNDIPALREHVARLEADLAATKDAAQQAAALQRKLAFYEAGVPANDPKARYFIAGYDGEMTDEAIKAAATEFFGPPPSAPAATTPPPTDQGGVDQQTQADINALNAMRTTTTTAASPADVTRQQEYEREMAAASSPQEWERIVAKYGVALAGPD